MSDYISREAITEMAAQNIEIFNSRAYIDLEELLVLVDGIPAADVAEVRHVHRKVWGIDEYYGEWLRCPNCGYEDNTINAKYCGGCGSMYRMVRKCG